MGASSNVVISPPAPPLIAIGSTDLTTSGGDNRPSPPLHPEFRRSCNCFMASKAIFQWVRKLVFLLDSKIDFQRVHNPGFTGSCLLPFGFFGDIKVQVFVNQETNATDPHYDYTSKHWIHFDTHILPLSSNRYPKPLQDLGTCFHSFRFLIRIQKL